MNDKHKPAIAGILFGVLLLLPLLASIAGTGSIAPQSTIGGGSIQAAGTSNTFYSANNTETGGIWIQCNNTYIDRLNRDVKFTVNATKMVQVDGWDISRWGTDVNQCDLNITLPDSTSILKTMTESAPTTSQIFTFVLETNITMLSGVYKIRADIWNATQKYTGGFDFTNVTIMDVYNIMPVGSISTNATTIYRNASIAFFISIFDPETPFPSLKWNVTIYKVSTSTLLKTYFKNDTLNQTYTFKGTNITGDYAFFVEIEDSDDGYFGESVSPFKVLNNPPVINSVSYNFTSAFKRVTDTMRFEVNVTDPDNVKNYSVVNVIFQHDGASDPRFPVDVNYTSAPLVYNEVTGNFTGNVTVDDITFPAGAAQIIIMARDNDPVSPAYAWFVPEKNNGTTISNNIPKYHGMLVNGISLASGLHFPVYGTLDFTFNVSDVEESIDYVRISLVGTDGTNITYFMLAPPYMVRVSISALSPGSWGVFVIVADIDGGILDVGSTGSIEVDPDLRDMTAYIIGGILLVIAGFVIGGLAIWRYANERISAIRRDMIIKAKSKDAQDVKRGKPGEKGAPSKYVEVPAPAEPVEKQEAKALAKATEKPATSRPFIGAQPPSAKGKSLPPTEKKPDATKPKSK